MYSSKKSMVVGLLCFLVLSISYNAYSDYSTVRESMLKINRFFE